MLVREKPMLIFTSCTECHACKQFRGIDGRPRDNQPWSAKFIRDKLISGNKLKALRIINIHDGEFGPSVSHIKEFIIYHMIPSTVNITPDFFSSLMENPDIYFGMTILRVKLEKNPNGSIEFSVEIDGNQDDSRCEIIKEQVEEYFLWNFIQHEFSRLRDFFRKTSDEKIEDILPSIRDDPFHDILIKEYNKYVTNPSYFEEQMKVRYGFSWFINFFYPEKIRDLESFYPSWMIVLPSEWVKGITDQESIREGKSNILRPIYAKVVTCKSTMVGDRFRSVKVNNENINDCLKQYYEGRLYLTYEECLLHEKSDVKRLKS